ncbi:MAG: DUF411 domain-containing protein [Sphingomicrobium sp.]
MFDRRQCLVGIAAFAVSAGASAKAATKTLIKVAKSPSCGCCTAWVEHLRGAGFAVQVANVDDVSPIARRLGVPDDLRSCHVAIAGGYFIEGHVPAADIARLLREKPKALGIAVPGMPNGSPGMDAGGRGERFYTMLVAKGGGRRRFAVHGG